MTNSSFWIGFFSLAHIMLASLGVGYMILAPIAEGLGRTRAHFTDLAYLATKFTLVTYTASIVLAVFMLELFIGLAPLTNSWLFNRFRSPVHVALTAFFVQLLCLYPYYHLWDRLRAKSVVGHMVLGGTAAVLILVWSGILDGIGSYMLTPVEGEGGWAKIWNPTWVPLMVHRFFGNFVIAGYVMAGYAGWRLWKHSYEEEDKNYYLMLLKTGTALGIGSLMIQPVSGYLYARQIQQAQPEVQRYLFEGDTLLLIMAQMTLFALLLLGTHLVFRPIHLERGHSRWAEGWYVLMVGLLIVLAPFPFYRRLVMIVVLVQTGWYLSYVFPVWRQSPIPSLHSSRVHLTVMALGIISLVLYLTMGTIREVARGPDSVYGQIERQADSALTYGKIP